MSLLYQVQRGPRWNRDILRRSSQSDPENVRYHPEERRLVDFPFDPRGGRKKKKKTVSRCKNTFSLPRSRRLSPRRDGYMHDSRKLNGSTSDRGHLFNCTKQTVHARWKIHAPLSYRIRKLAGRRGQIGLSAIKHGIRSNRSERASSFIFIGSTPSPARHTCPPPPPFRTILPADCKIPHSADRSPDEDIQMPRLERVQITLIVAIVDRSCRIIKWSSFILLDLRVTSSPDWSWKAS